MLKINSTSILFLFFFAVLQVTAQSPTELREMFDDPSNEDSTRAFALKRLIWDQYLFSDTDSALVLIEEGKSFTSSVGDTTNLVDFISSEGIALAVRGDNKASINTFRKALELAERNSQESMVATIYNNMGNVYSGMGDFRNAVDVYSKSLNTMHRLGDLVGQGNALNNIGSIYSSQNDEERALSYFRRSFKTFSKTDNKRGLANAATNFGSLLKDIDKIDSAMYYFDIALDLYKSSNYKIGEATIYQNFGSIALDGKDYENALKEYNRALDLNLKLKNSPDVSTILQLISETYLEMGDLSKAMEFAQESLDVALTTSRKKIINKANYRLYKVSKALGDDSKALNYYENYISVRDSLESEEMKNDIAQKRYEYEYDKKSFQDSVERAEHDKIITEKLKRQTTEIEKTQQRSIFLVIIIALVIISAVFIFRRLRISQKQNQIIERQRDKVEKQRNVLDEKNQEILDSMNYAKRLQNAILPASNHFDELFRDYFSYFAPKDVVSGDFYWLESNEHGTFIAAADCTGHGVPGALVSVVCSNALTKAVVEDRLPTPADVLDRTRTLILNHFSKSGKGINDGMDIALIMLPAKENHKKLIFSGAHNPFWLFRGDDIIEIKGDKQPVGYLSEMKPFTNHEVELEKEDLVYIFSDGYADQFGGPEVDRGGKKFKRKTFKNLVKEVREKPLTDQKIIIQSKLEAWQGSLEQTDDIVVLGFRF